MPTKNLLFEFAAKTATFRVTDTDPPLEEVSVVGQGHFKGRRLTTLYTVRITPTGRTKDRQDGAGILYLEGGGRATYRIAGTLQSTPKWREYITGKMTFGNDCTGGLEELKRLKTLFLTLVNSKGESRTKVWK